MLILLTVVIVAAIVVILLNKSGGSSNPDGDGTAAAAQSSTTAARPAAASATTGAASATTTASSSGSAKVVAQINLTPPSGTSKAAGIAEVLKEGSSDGIAIVAQNVTPNTTKPPNAYAVWLYNSPTDSHILGFVNPGVGANGRLSTAGGLPANAVALQAADRDPGEQGQPQDARARSSCRARSAASDQPPRALSRRRAAGRPAPRPACPGSPAAA